MTDTLQTEALAHNVDAKVQLYGSNGPTEIARDGPHSGSMSCRLKGQPSNDLRYLFKTEHLNYNQLTGATTANLTVFLLGPTSQDAIIKSDMDHV